MVIYNCFRAFFTGDELRNELHGAGAVDGQQSDDVLNGIYAEVAAEVLHPFRFQLEHGNGIAGAQQVIGFGVVQRNFVKIDIYAAVLFDKFYRVMDYGKSAQPQEVHFQQPQTFTRHGGEFGNNLAFCASG